MEIGLKQRLAYYDRPMKWLPRSVRGISAGQALSANEPNDPWTIIDSLHQGYGLIIALEPGDGTRYSIVLTPTVSGFVLSTTGGRMVSPVTVQWNDKALSPAHFQYISTNAWTQTFLHWWCTELLHQAYAANA